VAETDWLGEVIEANTMQFVARCNRLHEPPDFGSFVAVELQGMHVFGLVFRAATYAMEPGRRATAFGLDPEALRREQPQVYELLATDFEALVVGHEHRGQVATFLPPRPPHLHARVRGCLREEVARLTSDGGFLRAAATRVDAALSEELMAAAIRSAVPTHTDQVEFLVRMAKFCAELTGPDVGRLHAVISRLPL